MVHARWWFAVALPALLSTRPLDRIAWFRRGRHRITCIVNCVCGSCVQSWGGATMQHAERVSTQRLCLGAHTKTTWKTQNRTLIVCVWICVFRLSVLMLCPLPERCATDHQVQHIFNTLGLAQITISNVYRVRLACMLDKDICCVQSHFIWTCLYYSRTVQK